MDWPKMRDGNISYNIPTELVVGGQHIDVHIVDRLSSDLLGVCLLASGYIKIAKTTTDGEEQSVTSMENTFFHELVHLILDTMGETELSTNEKFVSTFASFLYEAIKSFKYDKNEQEITSGI